MEIAIDIEPLLSERKSGIGYYGENIIKELQKLGENKYILEFFGLSKYEKKMEKAKKYLYKNTKINVCRYCSTKMYLLLTMLIPIPRRLFFKSNPDISFYFNFIVPPFAGGKKVVVVHDMVVKDMPETMSVKNKIIMSLMLGRSLKRADKIVTISEFSKSRIIKHYHVNEGKIAVIPNGVDLARFKQLGECREIKEVKSRYGIKGKYLLYLGNLEPRKNIENLIEAYKKLYKKIDECPQLVIAGGKGWKNSAMYEKAKSLHHKGKMIFTGYLEDKDVMPLLNGAMVFCFPSKYEGFGLPVLEAMACGTPVLTSKAASMPEVGGECCEYCDPYSVDDIAEKLEILCNNKELRKKFSELGAKRAKEFSWNLSTAKLMEVFKELEEQG